MSDAKRFINKKDTLNLIFFIISFGCFLFFIQIASGNMQVKQLFYTLLFGFSMGLFFFFLLRWIGYFSDLHIAYYSLIPLLGSLALLEGVFVSEMFFGLIIFACLIAIYIQIMITRKDYRFETTIWFISYGLLFLWYILFQYHSYSPDSYSIYELSKSIFSDFYRVNTIRQYSFLSNYGCSFPPVMPVIMACVNKLLDFGLYAGTFINVFVGMATGIMLYKLSKRLFDNSYPGAVSFLFLLSCLQYVFELLRGRTIPLAILFMLVLLYLCLDLPRLSIKRCVMIGIVMGLGVMTRTDFIPLAGAAFFACLIFQKNKRLLNGLIITACALLVLSPWMYYLYTHFSVLMVSDNSRTVLMADMIRPSTYFAQSENPATLLNHPLLWMKNFLFINLKITMKSLLLYWVRSGVIYVVFITIIAVLISRKKGTRFFQYNKKIYFIAATLIVAFIMQFMGISATGFGDSRYYVPVTLFIVFFIGGSFTIYIKKKHLCFRLARFFSVLIVAVLLILSADTVASRIGIEKKDILSSTNLNIIGEKMNLSAQPIDKKSLEMPDEIAKMKIMLEKDILYPRIFFITISSSRVWEFGAYTGIYTAYISQPTEERMLEVLEEYIQPTHVYCEKQDAEWLGIIEKKYSVELISEKHNLYRVWLRQ